MTNKKGTQGFKTKNPQLISILFIIFFILPSIGILSYELSNPIEQTKKTVWASLYTWYGVPGQPAGKFGYDEWQKNASDPQGNGVGWRTDLSTMSPIINSSNSYLQRFNATATAPGQTLFMHINFTHLAYSRMYVTINLSISGLNTSKVELVIFNNEKYYSTPILTFQQQTGADDGTFVVNKVCFIMLNSTELPGDLQSIGRVVGVRITALSAGNYSLGINSLEGSSWKHYNEDYHTYPDEDGYYYNDPPVHLATANHVYYSGEPWPEIPSYGLYSHAKWSEDEPLSADKQIFYGIYDSLNETVIEAQLMLMEKAGIDVCQIMHPWSVDVVKIIFNVAKRINSNLKFTYYTGRTIRSVADLLDATGDSPYWYRIDGKIVITWGATGGLDEPFQNMAERARVLKSEYDVYLVADVYSSRYVSKDEMLDVYDCWYYYDTSAFYRHGYGDPRIANYQMDGTLYPLNAWDQLDRIFGSLSFLSHAKRAQYCAIVIPGTDNTAVHDFTGSPLYDGRTGTINERANGLTFNETWQAAIKSGADFVDIVSWNELHEGTEIEPTIENGTEYIELNNYWAGIFKN